MNALTGLKYFRSLDIGDCQLTDASVGSIREILHKKDNQSGKKIIIFLILIPMFVDKILVQTSLFYFVT